MNDTQIPLKQMRLNEIVPIKQAPITIALNKKKSM